MRYCVLVSHGTFAPGLHSALNMMVDMAQSNILSLGLEKDMPIGTFRERFSELVAGIGPEDEVLLFGDISGASPIAAASNILEGKGLIEHTIAIAGMNFPMVMSAVLADETAPLEEVAESIMKEASAQIKRIPIA